MSVPTTIVECMFTSPTWTDISDWVRSVNIKRGSSRVDSPILRYEAGTALLRLDNRDRRFDPTNLSGPYVTGLTSDSGVQLFTLSVGQFFGQGWTVDVRSASGQTATVSDVRSTASGTTGSFTVARPTGTASGKIMLAFHTADIGALSALTISGGASWTLLGSLSNGDDALQTKVWWKVAGGSEPSTYTFGQDSGSDGVAAVVTVNNADTAATPAFASQVQTEANTVYQTPSTTPAGSNDLEIRWASGSWGGGGNTWTAPSAGDGWTERVDKQSNTFTTACLATKQLTGSGSGSATRVIPMRPIRIRATWPFTATTNLIQNPSFEVDTTGWTVGGNGAISVSEDVSRFGGSSLKVSRVTQTASTFHYSAVAQGTASGATSGETVTISAYVYVPAASFSKITAYKIVATGFASQTVTGPTAADGWYRIKATGVLTGSLDDVQFRFDTDDTHSDGQTIAYIDGVMAEEKSTPSPYCDGTQPACSWSGTAHNSSSSRPSTFTFDLFSGFVDSWNVSWDMNVDSEVEVPCTDGFKVLGAYDRSAVSAVGAGEDSGARVTRILDSIGWSASDRVIATGNSTMQATTLDGDGLTELLLVADSEIGELYVRGDGKVVFRNRQALLTDSRSTDAQARFGDGGEAAGELTYHDVSVSYDHTQLNNLIRVARTGGSSQTAQDSDSIADFLTQTFERTDLLMQTDADALSYAQWVLYISKDPELRFDVLKIRPQKDETNLFPQVLAREIGDRITVKRRPVGGGDPVTREVFIRGIELDIQQYLWETTWVLQSATKVGSFLTLDHPTLSKIGTVGLVY